MRNANEILNDILDPNGLDKRDSEFPYAPRDWERGTATQLASEDGLDLIDHHWEAIRVLQACFAEEPEPPVRRLSDALEARFDAQGGRKLLFQLFPGGPVAQGCRLAGLTPPPGSIDRSFGSVR